MQIAGFKRAMFVSFQEGKKFEVSNRNAPVLTQGILARPQREYFTAEGTGGRADVAVSGNGNSRGQLNQRPLP